MCPADFHANHVYSEVNIKGTRDDPISASPPHRTGMTFIATPSSTRPAPRLPVRPAHRPAHAPARPEHSTQVWPSSYHVNNNNPITLTCFKWNQKPPVLLNSCCFSTEFWCFSNEESTTLPIWAAKLGVLHIWADSRKTEQIQTSIASSEPQTLTPGQPSQTSNPT